MNNEQILSEICDNLRDNEMHGIKMSNDNFIIDLKLNNIYDWYLKKQLLKIRNKKLNRILH